MTESSVEDRASGMPPSPPKTVAISGVVFSLLFLVSMALIRIATPADPGDPGTWLADSKSLDWVRLAIQLIPFAGIAFFWFMATLRNQIGLREDRFFSTVFLGSGFAFVGLLFVAGSLTKGLLDTFAAGLPERSETYRVGRSMVHALMMTYGIKMAGVFMFSTSTIGLRTGAFAPWVSYSGFAIGLVLLVVISGFAWSVLLIPFWVLLISVYILSAGSRDPS
jgi:hypothetical protein